MSSGDGVALTWGGTDHLEEVLGNSQMVLLLCALADDSVYYGLEDVLFGEDTLHVFDQLVGLIDFVVVEVVNDQIKSGFGDHIDKWWKHLQGVLASSKHDKVVSEQVVVLHDVALSAVVL